MRKPGRRTGGPSLQPSVPISQGAVNAFMAIVAARTQVMPPHVRIEFKRLGSLPEGRPTPEQDAWIDEMLRTYKLSEEAVQLCLADFRPACEGAQLEVDLQPGAKPGWRKRRLSASQAEQSIDNGLVFALANIALLYGVRETMPPDVRAEFDRVYRLAPEKVTPEERTWIKAAKERYSPSTEVFQRHIARFARMCGEELDPGLEIKTLPALKARLMGVTTSEPGA